MLVFVIGTAAFAAFLGWTTYDEFKKSPPNDWRGWLGAATLIAAQVCVWAVTIKAALS